MVAEFGDGVLTTDGTIDRPALARVVFGHPDGLARLEAISHPAINEELTEVVGAFPGDAIVVYDMAILVESNLGRGDSAHHYSHVLVVEAPLEVRIARAVARGMNEADARARAASQATDEQRHAVADLVVRNDTDVPTLESNVADAWATISSWAPA